MSEDVGRRQRDASGARSTDAVAGTVFSQVARLELDELLEQLVVRAHDVQDSQGRLRGLLRAYLAVAHADDLDTVLRPKADGRTAHFYAVVARDTIDQDFAAHRQRFLAEQGYAYRIVDADDVLAGEDI